jgi:plastocyanin
MRRFLIATAVSIGVWALLLTAIPLRVTADSDRSRRIALEDDCDPNFVWVPGGCLRKEGDVSLADFGALLTSPLSTAVVGHPSWRINPGFLPVREGDTLSVRNAGGRPHTFTEVAQFGGGVVPPFNVGLVMAPECATASTIQAGDNAVVTLNNTADANHRFQCCFHPWMRAVVKVVPKD